MPTELINFRMVASLDRKRLGQDTFTTNGISWSLALIGNASGRILSQRMGSRSEAFSIRRLGGSRWRLRRTRCAMGFEPQRGSEPSLRRAARCGGNADRMVDKGSRSEQKCMRKVA